MSPFLSFFQIILIRFSFGNAFKVVFCSSICSQSVETLVCYCCRPPPWNSWLLRSPFCWLSVRKFSLNLQMNFFKYVFWALKEIMLLFCVMRLSLFVLKWPFPLARLSGRSHDGWCTISVGTFQVFCWYVPGPIERQFHKGLGQSWGSSTKVKPHLQSCISWFPPNSHLSWYFWPFTQVFINLQQCSAPFVCLFVVVF